MLSPSQRRNLADALRERIAVIGDHAHRDADPAAHLLRLKNASERIEREITGLPPDLDGTLAHYLERRSYDKALAFLAEN